MTWATSINEKVNQITGLNVGLYAQTFSPEVGTLSWSTFVPDLPTLEAATDKLLVDDAYVSMVDAGAKFALGGADDTLLQIVSGEPDPSRQIQYVTTVQTVCASGNLTKGIELGIEIAQQAEKVVGTPVLFATGVTGNYGAVAWLSGYADVQEMERAQQALAGDAEIRGVRRQGRPWCLRRCALRDPAAHLPAYRLSAIISVLRDGGRAIATDRHTPVSWRRRTRHLPIRLVRFGDGEDDDPVPNGAGSRGRDYVFFTGMRDHGDQDFVEGQLAVDLHRMHPVERGVVARSEPSQAK